MVVSTNAVCEICNQSATKYKCPKCLIKYCSLNCFKTHKEQGCVEQHLEVMNTKVTKETTVHSKENKPETAEQELTEDTVKPGLLQNLGSNGELLKLLENPHLRQLLCHVDRAEDPAKAMEDAMQEPLFTEFADQCMAVVEEKI